MNRPPEFPEERLLDLLADQALDGLDGAELDELRGLLDDTPGASPDELAAVAAALALALEPADREPLPGHLRGRIESDAARVVREPGRRRSTGWKVAAVSGWIATAASWLVWAATLRPAGPEDPARALERLRPEATAVVLKATEHPLALGAGGEMVWSQARQRGYLRLTGLAPVDPARGAYQLWIFDALRDPRYPVDGGAFTLGDDKAPTLVPVKPSVAVGRPTLFAITLEPPGGVVVSDRRRILMTGEVGE